MVYATASKGFRPGGGTGPVPTSGPLSCEAQLLQEYGSTSFVPGPISFRSDHVWSYELGEKLRFADNRVTINGSVYFEKWIGVQQANALSSCGYIYTANAGNAHVHGAELEIQAIVVRDLMVSANAGYSDAALVSSGLINAGFNPGTPIQQVPRWTSSASISYRHGLTDRLTLMARADNTYMASRTDETYSINPLPSYDLSECSRRSRGGPMVRGSVREQCRGQARAAQRHHTGCRESADLQPRGGEPAAHRGYRSQLSIRKVSFGRWIVSTSYRRAVI